MARDWMTSNRRSDEYKEGVKEFVTFAKSFADCNNEDTVFCPCKACWNFKRVKISDLGSHLLTKGIDPSYKVWYWHGEKVLVKKNNKKRPMDRDWMTSDRRSDEYEEGVKEFVTFAKSFADCNDENTVFCPCMDCWNFKRVKISDLASHLLTKGIDPSYKVWYWHGEKVSVNNNTKKDVGKNGQKDVEVLTKKKNDAEVDDDMIDMLHGCGDNFTKRPDILCDLLSDADKPLYPGCTKFSRLSGVSKLFQLKVKNSWSDKSFTELLELLHEMLPEGNEMPTRTLEAKRLLCPMGVEYKKRR